MKERYVSFFKKEMVFLLVLLVIVCFSFGKSYSNFIYNSPSSRAVEMFISALDYKITINGEETNEVLCQPGNNIINVTIKSLNDIDTYYKIVYNDSNFDSIIYGNVDNYIEKNSSVSFKILINNKNNESKKINFEVLGGYTHNTIDDIKINDDYISLDNVINIGDYIVYNNELFRLLSINDDGSIDIIGENNSLEYSLYGSNGYNNGVSLLNTFFEGKYNDDNVVVARNVNIEDINKYTTKDIVLYGNSKIYYSPSSNIYYPTILKHQKYSVINNINQNGFLDFSDEYFIDDESFDNATSILIKEITVNEINFKNEIYRNIFLDKDYLLSTRYYYAKEDYVDFGILSIKDGNVFTSKLYDSRGNNNNILFNTRAFIKLSNSFIQYDELTSNFKITSN